MRTLLCATALPLALLSLPLPACAQAPKPAQPAPASAPAAPTTTMPTVGSPAPAFRLNDQEGHLTALGTARADGKWTVVAFYPKAATPG